ncbi:MAG: transglutaminase domain-containing protein, partial [Firmicutes bacterium]|nr:transglutaminase domain-containing protein [Bacillota bacterium]
LSIALILLCVLAYLIIRSGCRWLLLIYIVPAAALMFGTNTAPGIWAGLLFGFALLCAFAVMQVPDGGSVWLLALPLLALAVTLAAGLAIDQTTGISQSGLQKNTQAAMETLLDKRFGKDPLGKGDLVKLTGEDVVKLRGDSSDAIRQLTEGGRDETETALTITIDAGEGAIQPLWLRGFVGEIYQGHRWKDLGDETYYTRRDTQYWLNHQGFDGLSQLSEAALVSDAEEAGEPVTVTVRAVKADRSNIYIPYELTGTDQELPEGTQNYGGGFLRTDRRNGTREYTYPALTGLTGSWTDWVGRLYSATDSKELRDYYTNESHYNVWCYEHYTDVPDALAGSLYIVEGEPADPAANHADYKQAIAFVQEYLDKNFIYSENFEAPADGEDVIEQFLITGKGGDVHYASLATMMMRYYGIPARYVEGYLFTPADAASAKAGQAYDLGFSHAHAWTEIYIDGYGWVPMEFTSAWRGVMPEADLSRGLESISYESKNEELSETPLEEAADEEAPDYEQLIRRILLAAAIVLLALILLWILIRKIRQLVTRMRLRRSFADPDIRKGVCAMYGYMIAEGLPLTQQAEEIGDRAAYSLLPVYENERNAMRQELEWGEHEKKRMDKQNRGSLSDCLYAGFSRLRRK